MKNLVFVTFYILVYTQSGCTKEVSPEVSTNVIALTNKAQKDWTVGELVSTRNDKIPACELDDIYTFKANGQVERNIGTTKCSYDKAQTETWFWSFYENETKLVFNDINYSIKQLDKSTCKLSPIDEPTSIFTFKAK